MATANEPSEADEATPLLARSLARSTLDISSDASRTNSQSVHVDRRPPSGYDIVHRTLGKADTDLSWPEPAGLQPRGPNDEVLQLFRRAVGINAQAANQDSRSSPPTLDSGRTTATGIYASAMQHAAKKKRRYLWLVSLIYACHAAQLGLGAAVTSLGASADRRRLTWMGAANTVVAGILALVTRQGFAERLKKDEVAFRKVQAWIEETDALLVAGVVGRDRVEVGLLVEMAFQKFNATEAMEETNVGDVFVPRTLGRPVEARERDFAGREGQMRRRWSEDGVGRQLCDVGVL